jgi:hypothetical protein
MHLFCGNPVYVVLALLLAAGIAAAQAKDAQSPVLFL